MSADAIAAAVVSALSAGAATGATEAAKKAVADSYEGLKGLIRRKFGQESEPAAALEKLEAKPDSQGRRSTLIEELESVNAGSDPELNSAAKALVALVRASQGETHLQNAQGQGIAQADRGGTATVNYYGFPPKDAR